MLQHGIRSAVRIIVLCFYLFIVVTAWGTNYPLIKLAIADMGPLSFSFVRLAGGAFVLFSLLVVTRSPAILPYKNERIPLAIIGLLQIVSVLGLASIALLYLPAGRTVTLIYTMPFWAAVFEVLVTKRRPTIHQVLGMFASAAGLLLFLNPAVIEWSKMHVVIGVAITLAAAMAWGFGTVLYRSYGLKTPLLAQTMWQLFVSAIIIFVIAAMFESASEINITARLVGIIIWNWIVPTALAMWAWTRILNMLPGSIAGQLLMLTPFVGIAFSAYVFEEHLSPEFTISAVLISIGGIFSMIRRSSHASDIAP